MEWAVRLNTRKGQTDCAGNNNKGKLKIPRKMKMKLVHSIELIGSDLNAVFLSKKCAVIYWIKISNHLI